MKEKEAIISALSHGAKSLDSESKETSEMLTNLKKFAENYRKDYMDRLSK